MLTEFLSGNFIALLLFVIVVLLVWKSFQRPSGIPPGPPVYNPVFGHLMYLGGDSRIQMKKWREQYGDVFSLYFRSSLVVVISGYDTIKEAFVKNGDVFSDRSKGLITETLQKGLGIVSSSGPVWKEQRKFALEVLREFGFGKVSLQDKIEEEVVVYLKTIEEKNGKSHDNEKLLMTSASNIICSIMFGQRFEHGDPKFEKFLDLHEETFSLIPKAVFLSLFPTLRYLPGDLFKFKHLVDNMEKTEEFFMEIIEEHMKTFNDEDIRDFIDAYIKKIKECERKQETTSFHVQCLTKVIADLFQAGARNIALTIRWALVYLINYPDVQKRIHAEIDSNIARDRLPTMQDKVKLPYTEATILEVLRLAALVQLGTPHCSSTDTVFRGYHIPAGTSILPIMNSVHRDPAVFKDPLEFRPERYLDGEGNLQKPEEHIPFSLGRRWCLGESLARMELFLFISSMLQRFQFQPPEGEDPPSLEGDLGITYNPKPFKYRAILRN